MPKPKKDEKEKDFISRCIPIVMDEGTAEDNKQAAAVCYSMWRESKKEKEKAVDGEDIAAIVGALENCKAMGPDEESRRVRDAWYDTYRERTTAPQPEADDAWVKEVLDGKVLVEVNEDLYLYPFTVADDGEVAFGEPQKVRVEYMPVSDEQKAYAVKILREEDGGVIVGGPMCLYSDAKHKDLQGEYFTPETETMHDVYKSAPALFHHGLDETLGLAVIGHRVKAEKRPEHLWVEDWLDTSGKYWEMVRPLLEAKVLYYSPGSAPHLVRKEKDGRLLIYPVIEDTLTVTPAQHRSRPIEQIKAAYKAAGIELPEMPEPNGEPQGTGTEDGGPSCSDVERARAKAEATLSYIRTLEEVAE
jgi:hypothetical protein